MPIPSTNWTNPSKVSTNWTMQYDSLHGFIMEDAVCLMDDASGTMDDAKANSVIENSTMWNNP